MKPSLALPLTCLLSLTAVPAFAGVKTATLQFDCSGTATLVSTSGASYSPGSPPKGRFNGIEPSAGYYASLKVTSASPGCAVLKSKYSYDLSASEQKVWVSSKASSQPAAETDASQAVGETLAFKVNQSFGYKSGNWLPLFPKVHSEKMYLSGKPDQASSGSGNFSGNFSGTLNIDVAKAHQIPAYENLTDQEKLELFDLSIFAYSAKENDSPTDLQDFHSMMLKTIKSLGPKNPHLMLMKLWALFDRIQMKKGFYGFFDFESGGLGFYSGAAVAKTLNQLTHLPGAMSAQDMVDLLFEYPTLLTPQAHTADECPAISTEILNQVVDKYLANFDRLSPSLKWNLQHPLGWLVHDPSDKNLPSWSKNCTEGLVTEEIKLKAQELQAKLTAK